MSVFVRKILSRFELVLLRWVELKMDMKGLARFRLRGSPIRRIAAVFEHALERLIGLLDLGVV